MSDPQDSQAKAKPAVLGPAPQAKRTHAVADRKPTVKDNSKPAPKKGPQKTKEAASKGKGQRGGKVHALPQPSPVYQRKPPSDAMRARVLAKRRRRALAVALCIGLPTLLGTLYYGLLATDQYESVSSFTVHSTDAKAVSGLEQIIGSLPGGGGAQDVLVVRDYILSRDMLRLLNEQENWEAHYRDPSADLLSRLPRDADSEQTYEYYLDQIEITHDTDSNALTMQVRAFTTEDALRFARAIIANAEAAVNRLADKARDDAISFAKREVESARQRVAEARQELLKLQGENAEINPMQSASALQGLRAELEGQLAAKRAQLSAAAAVMSPQAPRIVELRQQVRSLNREVERQRRRLVDPEGRDSVNESIARYEPAIFAKEFAERALQSALTSLEYARVDASRQHRYLVTIASPSQPDAPTHPERLLRILTVLLLSVVITSIGALVLATVREHSRT